MTDQLETIRRLANERVATISTADNVTQLPAAPGKAQRRIKLTPYQGRDPSTIPRREWAYPGLYVRKFLSVTIAPGGLGKTGLSLVEGLAMATGRDLLGDGMPEGQPMRVWFWNGEDPLDELERQVEAAKMHYRITDEDLGGRFFLTSGRDVPIKLAKVAKGGTVELTAADIEEVTREITENRIDVCIWDPFVTMHGVPESSNDAIDMVATAIAQIANDTGAAMGIVAHTRKLVPGMTEISADDSRGASALVNKARVARVLNRMTTQEAEQAGISTEDRLRYFRVGGDGNKQNLTPPSEDKTWRYNASVRLPNGDEKHPGDSVRVVTAWEWPEAFDMVQSRHVDMIRSAILNPPEGGAHWRLDVQSPQWAGKCVAQVLDMDPGDVGVNPLGGATVDKASTEKIKKIMKEWIKNGVLAVEKIKDDQRRERQCVVIGDLTQGRGK